MFDDRCTKNFATITSRWLRTSILYRSALDVFQVSQVILRAINASFCSAPAEWRIDHFKPQHDVFSIQNYHNIWQWKDPISSAHFAA